ncbi:TetR family transcriptional regulator [Pseudoduganella flava]|uniref:TetR family transcriptional regulator n=2 Tax=Pseudoduganella flava TaxID=871742 RepID=A0A562PQ21_9BURK|nr:TetR family transcriptional regulator [Pseudoduganella flava]TWI46555.1 TetR family transcriptional regulator [Pseudoduganella flava]
MARQDTTREQIVAAADRLFYEQGFDHTSFAHIADAVGISRGNFYYHFRAKDEILAAVIDLRLARTRQMLDDWQAQGADPAARIRSFFHMLVANRAAIAMHGCPVGTLCNELAKLDHPSHGAAAALFTLFRTWLHGQFVDAGFAAAEADRHALHALVLSQGIATLASALRDERTLRHEVRLAEEWLAGCLGRGAQSDHH